MKREWLGLGFMGLLMLGWTGFPARAQDSAVEVNYRMKLPDELAGRDSTWVVDFHESWIISPERSSIRKNVMDYSVHDPLDTLADEDSLRRAFQELIRQLPADRGPARVVGITSEFLLIDLPVELAGEIRGPMASLVHRLSAESGLYDLEDQLLSIFFHETWTLDPGTFQISKKVLGITPVMWQRRETTEGEPVNDADTGLPVYYKVQLEHLNLRNP
jgi:hypothetical protein